MPEGRAQTTKLLRFAMTGAIVAPVALFAYAGWANYRSISAAADERIERSIDVLTEHANKIFQSVEVTFGSVDEMLRGMSDADIRAREEPLHLRLKRIADALGEVDGIWIFDRDGRVLATSAVFPAPREIDVHDLRYFTEHMRGDIGTFVGEVLAPRTLPGPLFFSLSRRRASADGTFNGVLQVAILPRDISAFYERYGQTVEGAYFAMLREDGVFLARFPGPLDRPLRLTEQTAFRQEIAKRPQGGIYTTGSIIDGVSRRIGTRRMPGYPVYLSAGIETWALQSEWLRLMGSHLVFGLPATLFLIGMIGLATRRTQRLYDEVERREAAEATLRQAQKMEAVGHLTGGVAHDFNNLLTIIIGNLEVAQRQIERARDSVGDRIAAAVGNAMQGAKRAASLTQRLLAFSRRQPLDPKPLNVNRLIGEMSDLLRRSIGETIELETVAGGGLWRVEADPAELEAALLNLVVNARDAMPNGGKLTVETHNTYLDELYCRYNADASPGQYVMIAVTDNGAGMPPDVIARAFEPFFTTKASGQGTGLGLSQVYGFVKQSDGHVKIYSEPGEGTTVKIYLPRLYGEAEETQVKEEEPVAGPGHEAILVVEDDDDVRRYIVDTLRELNYGVVDARDAPAALGKLGQPNARFDLLLTDVVLPGMNGRELAEQAVRRQPAMKVLFMTGYSHNAIVHHGRLDPGVELIQKPVTQAALAARVRGLLDAAHAKV